MEQGIKRKSREFGVKAVNLHKQLSTRKKETVMSEELLRSGAGVGAALVKAECAMGKNDQITKVHIALQNCVEAKYWLEMLNDTGYLTEFEYNDTLKSCDEMTRLLVVLVKSLRAANQ